MGEINTFMPTDGFNPESSYTDRLPLLSQAEKVSLLSGVSFTSTAGVKRLGIPSLKVRKIVFAA